jgi:hypothetical protein
MTATLSTSDFLGLLISALAACAGLCGSIWPDLYRSSMGESYTPRTARITAAVLLLLGTTGLIAILSYSGGPIDFSPV